MLSKIDVNPISEVKISEFNGLPDPESDVSPPLFFPSPGYNRVIDSISVLCESARKFDARNSRESKSIPVTDSFNTTYKNIGIRARTYSASNLSDDLFISIQKPNGKIGLMLSDLTCSPESRNLHAFRLRQQISRHLTELDCPSQILSQLNNEILIADTSFSFLTGIAVIIDPFEKSLSFSSAGFHSPLHLRWRGLRWNSLGSAGIPMGIKHDPPFITFKSKFHDGDKILLLSDGFSRLNAQKRGCKTITEILSDLDPMHPEFSPNEVMEMLDDFVKSNFDLRNGDEITLVLIQV